MKPINEKQRDVLRVVATGQIRNAGYGNSNVDNRSFYALLNRDLVEFCDEAPGGARVTSTGLDLLGMVNQTS